MLGIDVAVTMLGWQEVTNQTQITDFLQSESKNEDIVINPAFTPWCAAFINACERFVHNPGTGLLNARSFLTYGQPISEANWQRGDIVVFHFPGEAPEYGHVTYLNQVNDDGVTIQCLGGNQDNKVKYSDYIIADIVGVRRYDA